MGEDMKRAVRRIMWVLLAVVLIAQPAIAASVPTGRFPLFTDHSSLFTDHSSLFTDHLLVSPAGPYTTPQAALDVARDGDLIEVRGGVYAGPLVVEKSVTLEGVGWPAIDGGGEGTVVTLAAPWITLRGFEVRGSGVEPDRDHAGIAVNAPGVLVENNRLRDVLFGVFVAQADGAIVRGNDITSKAQYEAGRKGDAIRLWYSRGATVENNHVHEARDVVAWYSSDLILRDNVIEGGRYGVHLMYCDQAVVERNQVLDNSVGIYTMYSKDVSLRENLVRGQRGASGYALGFKDVDDAAIVGNALIDNRAGVFLDGVPFTPQAFGRFEDNVFAFNDVGVILLQSARGNTFERNTFWENVEQVALQGGGNSAVQNDWHGNYWSDYAGFDADGDGRGDTPYRAERLFENLTDREPQLRALIYSPAAQAVEFAASTFPLVRPQPKLTDPAPRVQPGPLPAFARPQKSEGRETMAAAALALFGVSLAIGAAAIIRGAPSMKISANSALSEVNPPSVSVHHVSKRFGKVQALEGVSFEAYPAEAVALWGANGAGKTTLLKALLGLIDVDGQILIEGRDARREGKAARRSIGYVPQEAIFYDLSVQATMEFYARLKGGGALACVTTNGEDALACVTTNTITTNGVSTNGVSTSDRISSLLERLGLTAHARKPVPALSGGLKQRLALALALLTNPPVLLLDEPTASLDAQAQRDYLALLASLRRDEGKTIIFASHRLEEVEALANRVLVLEQGRLVDQLTPIDLLAKLMPEIELTLWVPEAQRPDALDCLTGAGLSAHLNGRGTVVVRVRSDEKMQALQTLQQRGITVENFEVERK